MLEAEAAHHRLADHHTTRDGGRSWRGVVFCSCGWAGGVVDHGSRVAAEIELRGVWERHSHL